MTPPFDAERVLRAALARGGEFAEVFWETTRSATVVLEAGRVEEARSGVRQGAGIRVVEGEVEVYGYRTAPDGRALLDLASEVAGLRPAAPPVAPAAGVAPSDAAAPPGDPFAGLDLETRADLVRRLDRAARAVDPRVVQVRVVYRDHTQRIWVAPSDGPPVVDLRFGFYLGVLAVARDGRGTQTGYEALAGSRGWDRFSEEPPERAAAAAARRAVRLLEAPRAPGGRMPVVLAGEAGGTMIHEAVGHGLEADLVLQGHSVYAGRVGQPVASERITVVDDPTLPGRRGSYRFDDEGTPARRTVLIENGVLRGFLHSRSTARRMGTAPTGHGRRESFACRPIPRMANTFVAPGADDPGEILRDTPAGLYVTRMGGGQVDTVSGDFVFEVAEGFRIENGRAGEPVRGATLVGNGPRVLLAIDRVGSDLGFSVGTCGKDGQGVPVADAQPTLRIPELVVGGEAG